MKRLGLLAMVSFTALAVGLGIAIRADLERGFGSMDDIDWYGANTYGD